MTDLNILKYKKDRKRLEEKFQSDTISIKELTDLGAIYMYFSQEDEAIPIYERIIETEPNNIEAKIWLAYNLCAHPSIDDFRPRIIRITAEIIECGGEFAAAGYQLLDWGLTGGIKGEANPTESVRLLQNSVAAAPEWSANHFYLSHAYKRIGKYDLAIEEARKALTYVIDKSPNWSLSKILFEDSITGRYKLKYDFNEVRQYIMELETIRNQKRDDDTE